MRFREDSSLGEGPDSAAKLHANLDGLDRKLAEAEAALEALKAGSDPDLAVPRKVARSPLHESYAEVTVRSEALRSEIGWEAREIDQLLSEDQRLELEEWRASERVSWDSRDFIALGLAAVVGAMGILFDDAIDASVRERLGQLKECGLVKGFETDAKRLPIDYTGPNFGGPDHRVRSSGHDLGRPLAALRQIREGQFRGVVWEDGVMRPFATAPGRFVPVDALGEALTLWIKHLIADFVTPMSLPLPGWTLLYELPSRDLRKFAHDAYRGSVLGEGLNIRSGVVSPSLLVLSTEAIIRTHVHARALGATGRFALTPAMRRTRNELLLAGHSLVGAISLGKTLFTGLVTEGPIGLRHLNVPVLLRIGLAAARVREDVRNRARLAPPSWEGLLSEVSTPWLLEDAERIDEVALAGPIGDALKRKGKRPGVDGT